MIWVPQSCGQYGFSPHLDYLKMIPDVQSPDIDILCICILFPIPEQVSVVLYLITPFDITVPLILEFEETGKFTSVLQLKDIGRYTYWVEVSDESSNILISERKHFWIALSRDDRDSDLIPDDWERLYGLDPEDPFDAALDYDSDGFTNREEYMMGTNPREHNSFENNLYRLRTNMSILLLSFSIFLALLILSLYGIGRSRAWS
ncbi:MAG: hypothetical protein QCH96_01375 [Candidatus Thermoplasmatota archaeon]|nr:hypothetical protein [Candidatus Thermoplasmatota archaeon]